jgi:hypothetical protein
MDDEDENGNPDAIDERTPYSAMRGAQDKVIYATSVLRRLIPKYFSPELPYVVDKLQFALELLAEAIRQNPEYVEPSLFISKHRQSTMRGRGLMRSVS